MLPEPAPLVMALHGCRMTHDDVLRDWGLTAAADRHGFILVAPFVTGYDELRNANCWGFWIDGQRHQGRGEAEDLLRIAQAVGARHAVDPARRYIAGLSSGAAMSVVAATTHNEYWAAAASVAGLPYGEDAQAVSFASCPLSSASFHSVEQVAADMRAELDAPTRSRCWSCRTTTTAPWCRAPDAACATPTSKRSAPRRSTSRPPPWRRRGAASRYSVATTTAAAARCSLPTATAPAARWSRRCSTGGRWRPRRQMMRTAATTGSAANTATTAPTRCARAPAIRTSSGTSSPAIRAPASRRTTGRA
ncbi:PHB depolymerase family esterase [Azotobacter chroococcum]